MSKSFFSHSNGKRRANILRVQKRGTRETHAADVMNGRRRGGQDASSGGGAGGELGPAQPQPLEGVASATWYARLRSSSLQRIQDVSHCNRKKCKPWAKMLDWPITRSQRK